MYSHNYTEVSNKDFKFMGKALDYASNSKMLMKHGCVVSQGSKIIGWGVNSERNAFSDKFITNTCSCHAEMCAIRNALKNKRILIKGYQIPQN